ncbi:hypothetical protein JCM16303_005827 [Sporobolomyces ruberrimus]
MLLTPRKKLLVFLSIVSILPILALFATYRSVKKGPLTSTWTLNFVKSVSNSSSSSLLASTTTSQPELPYKMSAKSAVEQKISSGNVVVFSKSYCPYCRNAKQLLKSLDVDAEIFELDQMDEGSDWQNYLAEKTGQRTVPNIFIGGAHVGGSSDLEAKHRSGELKKLLGAKA